MAQIQGSTDQAIASITGITERIREISGVATSIAVAVLEQDAATKEIVRNVAQAAQGRGEVTPKIAGVAGAAEETDARFTCRARLSHAWRTSRPPDLSERWP
jgi:methyl-accepting chemotaxis protein